MRYQPEHKEKTRQHILAAAGRLFRQDGVVATGVVGLMKSAGLTQGGFYAHFESKEALVREALVAAMGEAAASLEALVPAEADPATALGIVFDAYLSMRHLRHPERGCAIAAAGAELAREPAATRAAVTAASEPFVALIARHLPAGCADPSGLARAVFGLLVGTLQLARMATHSSDAAALLADGKAAALKLCA